MSHAYRNGALIPPAEAIVAADDAGFRHGDGLFETLLAVDGEPHDLGAHLDRLLEGLDRIGIAVPESREDMEKAVHAVGASAPRPAAALRIVVSRGPDGGPPTRLVTARGYRPPDAALRRAGVAVRVDRSVRLDSGGPLVGLKSLSYQAYRLALARAEGAGAFEALLLNERGRLVEGSRSNLVLAFGDRLFTPPARDGCLPGTVRRRLLESDAVRERSLGPDDLIEADEVLLTNSLIGVLPVATVDGRSRVVGPRSVELGARLGWPGGSGSAAQE